MVGYSHLSAFRNFGSIAESLNEPRRDEPRRDEPKRDEPKRDEPRRDEPKLDEPKPDKQNPYMHHFGQQIVVPNPIMYPRYATPSSYPHLEQLLLAMTVLLFLILICCVITTIVCAFK